MNVMRAVCRTGTPHHRGDGAGRVDARPRRRYFDLSRPCDGPPARPVYTARFNLPSYSAGVRALAAQPTNASMDAALRPTDARARSQSGSTCRRRLRPGGLSQISYGAIALQHDAARRWSPEALSAEVSQRFSSRATALDLSNWWTCSSVTANRRNAEA